MKRLGILVVAVLALAGCGGDDGGKSEPSSGGNVTSVAADPYDVYLANNPDPSIILTREDAALRARLGCGTKSAPGTIDAVLAEAYADFCP